MTDLTQRGIVAFHLQNYYTVQYVGQRGLSSSQISTQKIINSSSQKWCYLPGDEVV